MLTTFGFPHESAPGPLTMPYSRIAGLHFTRLKPDSTARVEGPKAKFMKGQGRCCGAPIVLAPMNDMLGLIIAEGIETALSVHQATGLGCWATGCASFMPALADAVPAYCEHVTVIADADPAGQRYAPQLADRLVARGIPATIATPRQGAAA